MTTYAIAHRQAPKEISLWCTDEGLSEKGYRRLNVTNGGWTAEVDLEMNLYVAERYDEPTPVVIVWEGDVPKEHARNYNDAIKWITEEICK